MNIEDIQIPIQMEKREQSETADPECPWYDEDNAFDAFDQSDIPSTITTNSEKYILGVFPYGPNNQMRGFRDTILVLKISIFIKT